jgi:hypothetical protein
MLNRGGKEMSAASEMLELLPVPAYLFDVQRQRFFAANQSFQLLLQYSEQELQNIDWRQPGPRRARFWRGGVVNGGEAKEEPAVSVPRIDSCDQMLAVSWARN